MTNIRDLLAGVFVLVCLLLFLLFLGWSSDIKSLFSSRTNVTVLMRDAVPLTRGTAVRYEGMLVGEIADIRLRSSQEKQTAHPDHNIALDLSLAPTVKLTEKTPVLVAADGLLGARYVDLRTSPPGARALESDQPLLGELAGIDSVLFRIGGLIGRLNQVLDRFGKIADPSGGPGSIPDLLRRASGLTDDLGKTREGLETTLGTANDALTQGRDLLERFGSTAKEAEEAIATLQQILTDGRDPIAQLLEKANATLEAMRGSIDTLGTKGATTLDRVDALITRNDRNISLSLHHLRVATEELKLALARVRADPSQLLWGGAEDPNTAESAARKSLERDVLDKGFIPPRRKR